MRWRYAVLAAASLLAVAQTNAGGFLEPDAAFSISARALDAIHIEVRYDIAPGYYLYRERLNAQIESAAVQLAEVRIPAGKVKYDETFEKEVEYFRGSVTLVLALAREATQPFKLSLGSQGCADKGLCYSPQKRAFKVEPAHGAGGMPKLIYLADANIGVNRPTTLK
jgi:thioredoxin:protein disulfide reductase